MPASQQKLVEILARENAKTGHISQRSPALMREMVLDTHNSAPLAQFGPSRERLEQIAASRDAQRAWKASMSPPQATEELDAHADVPCTMGSLGQGPPVYRSVFKPHPGQMHASMMGVTHRKNIDNSEWALIESLEVEMFNKDRQRRKQEAACRQERFRAGLDIQMLAKEAEQRREEEARVEEGREQQSALHQYRAEERMKAEAMKARNMKNKADTVSLVLAAREAKAAALQSKKEMEAKFMRECEQKMLEEQVIKAAEAEARKEMQVVAQRENKEKLAQRAEEEKLIKEKDEAIAKAAIERAIKLDESREAAVKAMAEAATAKLNRAMAHPSAKAHEQRIALEEEWQKRASEQAEAKATSRATQQTDKRERMKSELIKAHEEFLQQKKRQAEEARAEMDALRKSMNAAEIAEREYQMQRTRAIRGKAFDNRLFLSMQMQDNEERSLVDDVGMSDRERHLNLQLLEHAVKVVGPVPKQITANFS